MGLVKEILDTKGYDIWSVGPETVIYDAVNLMSKREVGALLVLENEKLAGMVTERDYARKVILEGKSSKDFPVKEIMTRRVLCVKPERTVEECMALMTDKRVRHLPIVENKHVIGIVSIGDLVKAIVAEQKFLIDQLQHYITGEKS